MIEAIQISWLEVRRVGDRRVLEVLAADLDAGESEAVALALELKAERLVMDDLDAGGWLDEWDCRWSALLGCYSPQSCGGRSLRS